ALALVAVTLLAVRHKDLLACLGVAVQVLGDCRTRVEIAARGTGNFFRRAHFRYSCDGRARRRRRSGRGWDGLPLANVGYDIVDLGGRQDLTPRRHALAR